MSAGVSTEHAELLEDARRFAKEHVAPLAARIDAEGSLPRELIRELGSRRYLGATFPAAHGGLSLEPVAYGLLTEALGSACANTRALLTLQVSLVGEALLRFGTKEQVESWAPRLARGEAVAAFALSEPEVGSDAQRVQTEYRSTPGGYLLRGHKRWASFATIADLLLVIARDGEKVTAFLVERDRKGLSVEPMKGLLGMRGAHVGEVELDDVEVPKASVLGGEGNGFAFVAHAALDHGRYSIAWAGEALCLGAVEQMSTYARERRQFGKALCEHQLVQGLIGEATMWLHAARASCLRAGQLRREGAADATAETAIAKYFTSTAALAATSHAVQVLGGNGCWGAHPAERLFREAKVLQIVEGTTQLQQQAAARFALQRYAARS